MKNAAVLTEDGAFALFFGPHPGGFDDLRVAQKNANAWGSAGGGGGGLSAAVID